MKFLKKIGTTISDPPIWLTISAVLIAVSSIIATSVMMIGDGLNKYGAICYVMIGIMAVTAAYSVFCVINTYPKLRDAAIKNSEKHPFWNKLLTEYGFRTMVFLVISFIINAAFVIYNGVIALMIRSVWFGVLTFYYFVLILMRSMIIHYNLGRRKAIKRGQSADLTFYNDTKVYGNCGYLLVFLTIALSLAVAQMVLANQSFVHRGITIYAFALHAFYKITMAIYNAIKTVRSSQMTVKAVRNINLADAMVSIIALQTAMFRQFGAGLNNIDIDTMNAVTGIIVCVLVAALGIIMIINSIITRRKIKSGIFDTHP